MHAQGRLTVFGVYEGMAMVLACLSTGPRLPVCVAQMHPSLHLLRACEMKPRFLCVFEQPPAPMPTCLCFYEIASVFTPGAGGACSVQLNCVCSRACCGHGSLGCVHTWVQGHFSLSGRVLCLAENMHVCVCVNECECGMLVAGGQGLSHS